MTKIIPLYSIYYEKTQEENNYGNTFHYYSFNIRKEESHLKKWKHR
jgi:hypothetical protein